MLLRNPWRSLRVKIIAWSFIPTIIILLAAALATFYAYQRVTEDLVLGRNQELTRLSASQLAADVTQYSDILTGLARMTDMHSDDPSLQRLTLRRAANRLVVFDAGVVVINRYGRVIATEPARPEVMDQNWSNRPYYWLMLHSDAPAFSDIVRDGPDGSEVIVVAVPILGDQGEFRGTMAGMFRLGATSVSAFYGGIVKQRIGENGTIYLLDGNGRVIYHSDNDLIGNDLSRSPVVQQLMAGKSGQSSGSDATGHDIVATYAPVPGTPWGLVTEERWDRLMSSSQGYRQLLMLLLALGVVVPALVVTVAVGRVTGPIAKLIDASQRVAGGDFGQTITVATGDELEELATQFNLMSAQLQESYAGLERKVADRTKELATLNAIAAVVSRSLELGEILHDALDKTLQTMDIESGGIYLLESESGELVLAAYQGLSGQFAGEIDRLKVGEGFSGRVVENGEPVVVKDMSMDPWLTRTVAREAGYRSLASVPVQSRGRVLGALFAATRGYREFTPQDIQLLSSIGHQIGVAVENAQLFSRAQRLAVMEERNRLARDLHDSVTQAVYGVTLYAEAAARLLSVGQVETAASHLGELRCTAQQALREMRSLIFELRPSVLEKEGLVAALQSRLESVEGRTGLRTELKVEGESRLSKTVEEGLYRICQEALNNVLKHSQARSVGVQLQVEEKLAVLEIHDDGAGFDPDAVAEHGGLGLRGMEERAAQLGARMTIRSSPGAGTTIRVEVCP